jgi:HPt (histidine-containing phosphotransfer) domain-containing protein
MLNFYISYEIADDAVGINLAGRQRMLSQKMTKSLLEYSASDYQSKQEIINDLQNSKKLFDETLAAFDKGGFAKNANGEPVLLGRVEDQGSLEALQSAKPLWNNYKSNIERLIEDHNSRADFTVSNSEAAIIAIAYARTNNIALLKLMNDLTISMESVAASKALRLRLIQTVGILMALINFFIILFHFVGQLRRGDKVLDQARKETSDILGTVNEGLFLVHSDFTIGSQRSNKLQDILGIKDKDEINFEYMLEDIVSEKDSAAAHGFLRLLFNPKIKEKLISSLNPLERVEVNLDEGKGVYKTKYLSFDFKRVMHDEEIVNVLVSVKDITENVLLERALNKANEKSEKQIEMLSQILQSDPITLKSFIDGAYAAFARINNLLKTTANTQTAYQDTINKIFSEIHNFKGEASSLNISEFVEIAHEFEDELDAMRSKDWLKGQDFLSLAVNLDKLIDYAQTITKLIDKMANFTQVSRDIINSSREVSKTSWQHLNQLVTDLSTKYDKQATLVTSGLNEVELPRRLRDAINSVCIQFIRNAMVHGIETPNDRELLNKSAQGRIDIHLSSTANNKIELVVRDDGAGFDYGKIREQAIRSGKWSEEELSGWDNKKLLSLIFAPGFSTASQVTEDAGRGVGMDVALQKIKALEGKVSLSSRKNQFSSFAVTFPLAAEQQAA